MTNLMSVQNQRVSPNKNKENQFIGFRLLTKKKEKPRFFLLFHQSEPSFGKAFLCAGSELPGPEF
ncbi:hypothetical protein A9B99_16755 [Mangrovibacter phragmitis]|uniref:Uncharacterized protein n=1 Tax=Mangrovibacter phragmitis TaxID=1691903 RepID=A0A1B7KYN7_9ENTR|nr:hypothetical protein A9B99_16755 [Mangrovibacter phragmitis]